MTQTDSTTKQQTAPQQQLPRDPATLPAAPAKQRITGVFSKAEDAMAMMEIAQRKAHVVSPSAVIPRPPEGCEIAIAAIYVDVTNECYPTGGKKVEVPVIGEDGKPVMRDGKPVTEKVVTDFFGLGKPALERISMNAGVTWLSSRRVDNRKHPLYVEWEAWARILRLDGTVIDVPGNVTIDLRDGSADVNAIKARATGDGADKQIRDMRLFITRHAESKAKLRAIRGFGIRTGYSLAELKKPFIAVSLAFTGHSEDPELRRAFAIMRAERMLGATTQLYGAAPTSTPMRASAPPSPRGGAVIDTTADDDDAEIPPPSTQDGTRAAAQQAAASRVKLPSAKGKPIRYVDDPSTSTDDLEFWAKKIAENLEKDPDGRFAEKDRGILAAINVELARRAQAGAAPAAAAKPAGEQRPMTEEEKREAERQEREDAGGRDDEDLLT